MMLEADSLAERRRLKRRVRFWRTGAILLAVIAVVAFFAAQQDSFMARIGMAPHVARLNINGFIADNRAQQKLIDDIAASDNVQAVILHINSPGGTTAGAEALYLSLRRLAEKKPVVAVFGTAATSAAYLAGIAADHIVARGNSITGSVGVIMQWAEFSDLLQNWGVKVQEIRSGELKAVPSPFKPTDPASQALVEEIVNESRDWFVGLVEARRKINGADLVQVKSGRIYSGRQALEVGLIDAIGDEKTALGWLQSEHGVSEAIEIIERKVEEENGSFFMQSLSWAANGILGRSAGRLGLLLDDAPRFNHLDGLISLWHPRK